MCGISGLAGNGWERRQLEAMVDIQRHRGPDDRGIYLDRAVQVGLGHSRLSIIDLSPAGHQPMPNPDQTAWISFNGEIYNYLELRSELSDYPYQSRTDTEVVLAAYERWGERCLDQLIGMFAFILWDKRRGAIFAARDRFGVKPLYYAPLPDGSLALASEIKALHACGIPREMDAVAWATYLTYGLHEHGERTFWQGIRSLQPGHAMRWKAGRIDLWQWYDLASRSEGLDRRSEQEAAEEYRALLEDSVRLRFRSDVPVGINLSGGVDSSTLLGLVHAVQGANSAVSAFTFITGDERYDELPWVEQMLARTQHSHHICRLLPAEVPDLAARVQRSQDEPFGGLPTLAYSKVFETAKEHNVIVLLDGQGLDEQWAGYDYYALALNGRVSARSQRPLLAPLQGSRSRPVCERCLVAEYAALAQAFEPPAPFQDDLRNLQHRDACYTKIPRALRFNDRISMMHSTELREPFLDQRLFELALSQPWDRKIRNEGNDAGPIHKWLLRQIASDLLPQGLASAPKRPLQTPQREWLRGSLKGWAEDCIETALARRGGSWLEAEAVRRQWQAFQRGEGDNSYYIWQWISLGLMESAA